jgi:hypothetical protein
MPFSFIELLVHADGVTGSDGACHEPHLLLTAPVPIILIDCVQVLSVGVCLPSMPKVWQSTSHLHTPLPPSHFITTPMQDAMHIYHDATQRCTSKQPSHSPPIPTTRSLSICPGLSKPHTMTERNEPPDTLQQQRPHQQTQQCNACSSILIKQHSSQPSSRLQKQTPPRRSPLPLAPSLYPPPPFSPH